MTDDKAEQLEKLMQTYADMIEGAYISIMASCKEEKIEIPPEQAATMAISAFIGARDTMYPRYSNRSTGQGNKSDGDFSGPKEYEKWVREASEGQVKRLQIVAARVLEAFARTPETKKDAAGAMRSFFQVCYNARWDGELPKNWNHNDTPLNSGQVSCLMDEAEKAFPGLMDKKGGK